jgi:hypothetical protein
VSAGITPDPGAMSRLPVWWSAADWSELEVPAAVWAHRDLCRAHHVEPDTVVAVARGMASFADVSTGRDCRPTNARLREVCRVSQSTVQRARRVLKELRLVVVVVKGRSVLTRTERLTAWGRGSSHRTIAATFALCSRGRSGRAQVIHRPTRRSVDRDHPPVGSREGTSLTSRRTHLRNRTEMRRTASRPAHTETSDRPGRSGPDMTTRRLAEATQRRLRWLAGVSARRITPTLSRFARAGWDARDVERAVTDALAALGWRLPRTFRTTPAAYLARVLRDVDPADRPGALDEWIAAEAAAKRLAEQRWVWALRTSCPHGIPAGDVEHPERGVLACPACRT